MSSQRSLRTLLLRTERSLSSLDKERSSRSKSESSVAMSGLNLGAESSETDSSSSLASLNGTSTERLSESSMLGHSY